MVNLFYEPLFSDELVKILNVTSSTPFLNDVCIEPGSTGGRHVWV